MAHDKSHRWVMRARLHAVTCLANGFPRTRPLRGIQLRGLVTTQHAAHQLLLSVLPNWRPLGVSLRARVT